MSWQSDDYPIEDDIHISEADIFDEDDDEIDRDDVDDVTTGAIY